LTISSTTPTILKETKHWLAVNKPAGMAVEGSKVGSPTVQSLIFNYLSQKEKKPYTGMVHRLDRVTTGVLLIAKKKSILKELNELFRIRQIQKTYLALSDQAPKQEKSILVHHLLQDRDKRKAILFDHPKAGTKECRLEYQHLAHSDMGYHLFQVNLLTGKYHQIRAQLSNINCPIVGDEKYDSKAAYYKGEVALHAWQLQFEDPIEKKVVKITAPPPNNPFWNDFKDRWA